MSENFLFSAVYCFDDGKMNDVIIACRIPRKEDEAVEKLVKDGKYINKSDFFRKAIKILLESESKVMS